MSTYGLIDPEFSGQGLIDPEVDSTGLIDAELSSTPATGGTAVGLSAGSSSCTAVGSATVAALASAAGVCTALAIGLSIFSAVGSAAGNSSAAAVGASTAASVGAAAGTSSASGVGASTAASAGSASGSSSAAAVGSSTATSIGTSIGTSTATAVGASAAISTGSSDGSSTATGVGASIAAGVGSSTGTSTADALSSGGNPSGSAAGTSTCSAVGQSTASVDGSSAGTSTAAATAGALSNGSGSVAGTSSAAAVGKSIATGVGSASGTCSAAAFSPSAESASTIIEGQASFAQLLQGSGSQVQQLTASAGLGNVPLRGAASPFDLVDYQVPASNGLAFNRVALSLDPLIYYRFDESSVGQSAVDQSGHGLDSVPYNLGSGSGFFNFGARGALTDDDPAITFGVSANAVRLNDVRLSSLQQMTLLIWVRSNDTPPSPNQSFLIHNDAGVAIAVGMWAFDTRFATIAFDAGTGQGRFIGLFPQLGWNANWHMIALTFNQGTMELFIDGGLIITVGSLPSMNFGSAGFTIGDPTVNPPSGGPAWTRDLDECLLFDYALTADQVSALWNAAHQP